MGTNHVDQDDGEVAGVSSDGIPSNILRSLGSIPRCTLGGVGDGQGVCGSGKEEGGGKDGEGTHCFDWKEERKGKEVWGESEDYVGFFKGSGDRSVEGGGHNPSAAGDSAANTAPPNLGGRPNYGNRTVSSASNESEAVVSICFVQYTYIVCE